MDSSDWITAIILVVVVGGIIITALWQEYKSQNKPCPKCGKRFSLKLSNRVETPKPGSKVVNLCHEDWLCKNCGYTQHKEYAVNHHVKQALPRHKHHDDNDNGDRTSSGGSFGGGSYGGGGAGGHF